VLPDERHFNACAEKSVVHGAPDGYRFGFAEHGTSFYSADDGRWILQGPKLSAALVFALFLVGHPMVTERCLQKVGE